MDEVTPNRIAELAFPKERYKDQSIREILVSTLAMTIWCYKELEVEKALKAKPTPTHTNSNHLKCNSCGKVSYNLECVGEICLDEKGGIGKCKGKLILTG